MLKNIGNPSLFFLVCLVSWWFKPILLLSFVRDYKRFFLSVTSLALLLWGTGPVGTARAEELNLVNDLTFYGDNTEFFEPFRLRQTILGQQFESYLDAPTGDHTGFWAGLFVDHPSAQDTEVDVKPILSFRFHDNDSTGIFGTLQTVARHGLIEPLEVTTLELTRPIEYGLQWLQEGKIFKMDAFLDWQDVLTFDQREIFDYGGSAELPLESFLSLEGQYHGYHVGGVSFPGPVWNNFATALGPRVEVKGPGKGPDSLTLLGLTSKTIDLTTYPGPEEGYGFYAKAVVWLFPDFNLFGIDWVGKDFYSYEGDSNYDSVGYDGVYYQSNRTYEELGLQLNTVIESGITFDFEFRLHWIEDSMANSFRIVAQAPFDVGVELNHKKIESTKDETLGP
jgi:hypothetical protein